MIDVKGGGITGQAGAVCQGVARALKEMFGLTDRPSRKAPTAPSTSVSMAKKLARLRLPDPRRPHEGTQEVRPQGRTQELPVLETVKSLRRDAPLSRAATQ